MYMQAATRAQVGGLAQEPCFEVGAMFSEGS